MCVDNAGLNCTSFMNGMSSAFDTNPGTSFDVVTSGEHQTPSTRHHVNIEHTLSTSDGE